MPKNPLIVDTKIENIYDNYERTTYQKCFGFFKCISYLYCVFFWQLQSLNQKYEDTITPTMYIDILLLNPSRLIPILINFIIYGIIFEIVGGLFLPNCLKWLIPLVALLSGDIYRQMYS
jgi:hypothetical protein